MELGVSLGVEPEALDRAPELEAAGFSSMWFADFQLVGGDPYVFCALAAQRTRRLRVGISVSNPRVRHLTVLANLAATLEVLFPGRAIVGLGTGFSPLRALRLAAVGTRELESFITNMRELAHGQPVSLGPDGPEVRFSQRSKYRLASSSGVRIAWAAGGPQALRAAGRVADEVLIGVADPGMLRFQIGYVREGAEQAGRAAPPITVFAGLYLAREAPSTEELRASMGTYVPNMLASNYRSALPHVAELGALGASFQRYADLQRQWSIDNDELDSYMHGLSTDLESMTDAASLRAKIISGSVDAVRARLQALVDVGVQRCVFFPDRTDPEWFASALALPGQLG